MGDGTAESASSPRLYAALADTRTFGVNFLGESNGHIVVVQDLGKE